jgi:hypothetical protein
MAVLPGSPYNYAEPGGCLYLVPVVGAISTQTNFFAVHESHHMVLKKLIEGADYVKGTHLKKRAPYGVRGNYKKHNTHNTRRAPYAGMRGKYKKRCRAVSKYKNLLPLQESLDQKAPAAAPAPAPAPAPAAAAAI